MMPDPAVFLSARLAEDEARLESLLQFLKSAPRLEPASSAGRGMEISWSADPHDSGYFLHLRPGRVEVWFREDPRRLEHDLLARRQIAADHRMMDSGACASCVEAVDEQPQPVPYPCPTLRRLTWIYTEHPEYDESWNVP